ncbi:MAG: hypothetical protein M5U18_06040 [Dehalococcoidia bacterium]|nr:hypothetical protein [Dehalococcoidia bacterium]
MLVVEVEELGAGECDIERVTGEGEDLVIGVPGEIAGAGASSATSWLTSVTTAMPLWRTPVALPGAVTWRTLKLTSRRKMEMAKRLPTSERRPSWVTVACP